MSFPFNYGMSIYMPPGPDMDRVDRAWGSLGSLLESRQNDKDTNSVAQMAAERMRSLGPQGEQWAKMIQSNPRAALASMEQYGGPMEIENQIIGARAQGEASAAIGQMQQSGASPQEIVGFILRTQGPKAAQAAADALGTNSTVSPKAVVGTDGKPIYVSAADAIGRQPVPRAPLVQVGGSGFEPDQAAAAEDRVAGQVDSRVKPLQDALDAYSSLTAVVTRIRAEGREPSQSETDTIVKLASRLENPEAVQEGDIARKAGGTFMNAFRAKIGMGVVLDPGRLETIMSVADTIAQEKSARLNEILSSAQAVAEERGLNPRAVAPAGRVGSTGRSSQTPIGTRRVMQDPDSGDWIEYEKVDGGWDPVQ
jgi:hypothetical protein